MKGSIFDLAYIGFAALMLSVVLLVVFYINHEYDTANFLNHDWEKSENSIKLIDSYLPIVLMTFFIVSAILSYFAASHPIFMTIGIIVYIIIVAVSAQMSNIYFSLTDTTEFSFAETELPISYQIMTNLPFILTAFGIILLIFTYGVAS